MPSIENVEPRLALVTGASTGIGRALAIELARNKWNVHLVARRESLLREVVGEILRAGNRASYTVLDVSQADACVSALRALDLARPVDLVIANAGVGAMPGHEAYTWEGLGSALQTNFVGAAATLTALAPAMVQRGHGHLVGIGSLASFGALPFAAAYCAPKAGLSMLLECLSIDLAGTGVAVTDVRLGFVQTQMVERSTHPLPQLLQPEEAAKRIVRGLRARPKTLTLPQPFGLVTRIAGVAPRALRHAILTRLGRRYAPGS